MFLQENIPRSPTPDPVPDALTFEKQVARLMDAWNAAGPEAREEFPIAFRFRGWAGGPHDPLPSPFHLRNKAGACLSAPLSCGRRSRRPRQ